MTTREYVELFLKYLEKQTGHIDWEIKEDGENTVRLYGQIPTVVGPRKVVLNFEDGDYVYPEMCFAEKFPCQNLSHQEFEKIMICINRINLWYSNTAVAFVDINEDGSWAACLRGIVNQMNKDFLDSTSHSMQDFQSPLETILSFMNSVNNRFGASYLEDFIKFFERE